MKKSCRKKKCAPKKKNSCRKKKWLPETGGGGVGDGEEEVAPEGEAGSESGGVGPG